MLMIKRARMTGAASMVAALALAATSLPTLAAPDGSITIQGQTVSVIELTLTTTTVDFGVNMAPDGTGNVVDNVYLDDPAGACFAWDGTNNVSVRSSVPYDLAASVTGAGVPQLFFEDVTYPASWADCNSGAAANAGPLATMASGAGFTAGTDYNSHLSVAVPWTSNTFNVATTIYFVATEDV